MSLPNPDESPGRGPELCLGRSFCVSVYAVGEI